MADLLINRLRGLSEKGYLFAGEAAEEIARLREKLAAMTTLYVDGSNAADEEIARLRAQVESLAPQDPMDMPLPCDVTVGNGTHLKGSRLGTLVHRMRILYSAAFGPEPTPYAAARNLAVLQGRQQDEAAVDVPASEGVAERAAEMLTGYAELVKMTGTYSESHYIPEIEFVIGELRAQHAAARGGKT